MPTAISFLHPALAVAGLAAGTIPLIIHLINRRRHRRVEWAAMVFLLAASRRRARRLRWEQWLLFAVRTLAIVLFGLAVARPLATASRMLAFGPSHAHRVILIDNSGSMSATSDPAAPLTAARARAAPESQLETENSAPGTPPDANLYSRARELASALLDSFPSGDEVSIVSLADPAAPLLDYPSYDRRQIREALARLPLTQRSTDPVGACEQALRLLDKSSAAPGNRYVYVLSDLAGEVWRARHAPNQATRQPGNQATRNQEPGTRNCLRDLAQRAALFVVPLGDPTATNAGLSSLVLKASLITPQLPVRCTAEVVNGGALDLTGAELLVHVLQGSFPSGERSERRIPLPRLAPGQTESVDFSVVFNAPGSAAILAQLEAGPHDRLALDNDRWLAVHVTEAVEVLLVDGAPGRSRLEGQAGYLLTALNPWSATDAGRLMAAKAVSELHLATEVFSDYDVVVLCNVERPNQELWARLTRYVQGGGGLLIFAGDLVNIDHYNRYAYADGAGPLPGKLRSRQPGNQATRQPGNQGLESLATPVRPPGETNSQRGTWNQEPGTRNSFQDSELDSALSTQHSALPIGAEDLRFALADLTHPVTADFEGLPASGLFTARVHRRIPVEVDPAAVEVVLRYSNSEPAVVVRPCGRGRCGLVTTSADMAWNTLPAKGDYVSLMMDLVAYLAQGSAWSPTLEVGQPIARPLAADEAAGPFRIVLPDGQADAPSLGVSAPGDQPHEGGLAMTYANTEQAGLYTTYVAEHAQYVAVNPPPEESYLLPIDHAALGQAVGTPLDFVTDPEAILARVGASPVREFGWTLIYVVLALLLVETWLASRTAGSELRIPGSESGARSFEL